jgi:hypothetical protein
MNDARQVFSEHLPQLFLYFSLYKALYDGDGIKGTADLNILQWVGLEHECTAFLLGHDE